MAIKSLSDFDGDHQAYADYLESAECANDEGYSIYVDANGNIYEATNGDWKVGHGHNNVNDPRPPRDPEDESSKGRPWKNPWLKYEEMNLTEQDIQFLRTLYYSDIEPEKEEDMVLRKKR